MYASVPRGARGLRRAGSTEQRPNVNRSWERMENDGTDEVGTEHGPDAGLLGAVLRQAPTALVVAEAPSGRVVLASKGAEAVLGGPLPRDAVVWKCRAFECLRPDGSPYPPDEWPLARSIVTGERVADEEVVYRRRDGTTGTWRVSSAPVRGPGGRVAGAMAVWTDVTETQRAGREREELLAREREAYDAALLARTVAEAAQLEAEAADTAKSSFLASMSHEIRTPINAIVGYTELLDMGLTGPVTEAQRVQLGRIRDSSRHLLGLVNEILDLAKVESGETEVDREPGRLRDAVDAARDLVRPQAVERGLHLSDRCEGDPDAWYEGDAGRVRQIAANLLSNAVKFTPPGGRIRTVCGVMAHPADPVFATHAGPWAFLSVEDNGVGITPEQAARIFEPFVQGEEGHTRRTGGTGLGLTISRKLARLMGGDLTVRSTPDEGSTFTLWLPAAGTAHADPPDPSPAAPVRRVRGIAGLGMRMLDEVDAVAQTLVDRLRADPPAPGIPEFPDSVLRNHMAAFLADIVQCLVILEESPDDSAELMQDGSAIQRTIADRHGFQRHRLGWTEEGVRLDYEVVMEELERVAREAAPHVPGADLPLALSLLRNFVQQATSVSVRSFRIALRAGGGN
jgi:signal transduction histidine kinase